MGTLTAAERRQQILEYLSANRFANRKYFASRFGVSEKTIRNDILELSLTAPVYTIQGNGGGITVTQGWYISRKYFTPEQEELLMELSEELEGEKKEIMKEILLYYTKPEAVRREKR